MACSLIKRKESSIQKDSEMATGRFLAKKCKFESSANGKPVNPEEELKKIYGARRQRLVIRKHSTEGSDESEEEDELAEGDKSLKNYIRIFAQKQSV